MKEYVLNAQLREKAGVRSNLRKLRDTGFIPSVVYGAGKENTTVYVNYKELLKILKEAHNAIIKLKYADKEEKVIIRDIQKHVVTGRIIHVDFGRIRMNEKIDVVVPIKFVGEPYGVKVQGGIVEYEMRELEIRCLPDNIPNEIEIDISNLKIGDAIRIKDLKPEKYEIRENPENLIVSVISVREEEVSAPTETPEQPEVIEKGKKKEEEVAESK